MERSSQADLLKILLQLQNDLLKKKTDTLKKYIVTSHIENVAPWRRGVVVIINPKLHSTKPELRFCAGSNPVRGVSEICDGEDL